MRLNRTCSIMVRAAYIYYKGCLCYRAARAARSKKGGTDREASDGGKNDEAEDLDD